MHASAILAIVYDLLVNVYPSPTVDDGTSDKRPAASSHSKTGSQCEYNTLTYMSTRYMYFCHWWGSEDSDQNVPL